MVEKITLSNGVRIIAEPIEHVQSASVGIWVDSGSRGERRSESGISHFIEHMVFKGTKRHSASDIADIMDGIGAQVNAFTTKECTSFYVRALSSHLKTALEVLCDMFFCPKMDEADVETEKKVINEEIAMYEDSPEDLVSERLFSAVYRGDPLEMPILGRPASLKNITGKKLLAYMRKNYRSCGCIVAVSGRYCDSDIEYLKERFSVMPPLPAYEPGQARYIPAFTVKSKDIEQNHICLAYPALPSGSDERYTLAVLGNILGGSMSSRLFQRLREREGLCYSVYSYTAAHRDTGILGIYMGLSKESEEMALKSVAEEIAAFAQDGVTERELDRSREQIKAGVVMSLESTNTRMNHMARSEMILGRVVSPDEIIERYDAVTLDGVNELSRRLLKPELLSLSAVGRVKSASRYKELIK